MDTQKIRKYKSAAARAMAIRDLIKRGYNYFVTFWDGSTAGLQFASVPGWSSTPCVL